MTSHSSQAIVELPAGRKFGKDDNAVFIAYSPLTGNARLMTSELADELHRAINNDPGTGEEMRRAVDDLLKMPDNFPEPQSCRTPDDLRNLVIIPNFTCNFRCSYGYASEGKENKYLPEGKLFSALDHFITPERSSGKKLRLTFLGGGEPLLAEDLIKKACKHAVEKSLKYGIPIGFSLVTNGSLITPDIAEMIKQYRIQTSVSFEILEDVQNIQRDQYENVVKGIRTLLSAGVVPGFRSIITDLKIQRQAEMVRCAAAEFPEIRDLSFEIATMPEKYPDHASMQKLLTLFCEHFRSAQKEAEKTGIRLSNSLFDCVKSLQKRFCPGEFVLTPDGNITCCHRITHHAEKNFENFCFGSIGKNNLLTLDKDKGQHLLLQSADTYQTCQDCPARWNCGGFCLIKRQGYTPEAMSAICTTIRQLLTDHLFDNIVKNTREMGIDVFEFFGK
ncbi:MAG: radical SAM protein [Lentisphaeria bacterium]|nr:radical SAM protein [Lentisphaeria bacterium]